jgi:hypothetical protein
VADAAHDQNNALEPLIGEWSLAMVMPGQPRSDPLPDVRARVAFEWLGRSSVHA